MKTQIKSILNFLKGIFNFLKFYCFEYKKIKNSRFIFFFPYYHTGGAERVHLNILQALKKQNCCIIFTHRSATKNFYKQFAKCGEIVELNAIRNKKSKFISKLLVKYLSNAINKSEIVKIVFGCNTNYYYDVLPFINSSKKRIDLIHAIAPDDDRKDMLLKSAGLLDSRVAINNKSRQDIINIYKEGNMNLEFVDRIRIIENGVHVNKKDKLEIKSFKYITIGFLGRWSGEKRPQIFLEVAKRIKKRFPEVEFVMAGTGMKSNLDQITNSGVVFLGEITNEKDLQLLYKKLSFVLITSVYEGFPMVVMESMVHGVIPMCTDVGGINEHITHMENGILINNANEDVLVEVFTKNIMFLIENKMITNKISNQVLEYSMKHFSLEKFKKSYQKLLNIS